METSQILLLEKLYYLEDKLRSKYSSELLNPWIFNSSDSIEVQKAAKKIGQFVGLPNLTFVVTYKAQKEGVGGHIDLNNNNSEGVFIEIDEKFKDEYEIVLAILAHEICHKVIHINSIQQLGYENEILTDVATIFTGLGKLSLNGCEIKRITTQQTSFNQTTTTTEQKVGYLSRIQFAFVYKVFCGMQQFSRKQIYSSLGSQVTSLLEMTDISATKEFFSKTYALNKFTKALESKLNPLKIKSATNVKIIKMLTNMLQSASEFDNAFHQQLKSTTEELIFKVSYCQDITEFNHLMSLLKNDGHDEKL